MINEPILNPYGLIAARASACAAARSVVFVLFCFLHFSRLRGAAGPVMSSGFGQEIAGAK